MFDTIAARMPLTMLRDDDEWHCDERVAGAYGATLHVRRRGSTLCVAGSYPRFMQGHNVWSGDNLVGLCGEVFGRVADALCVDVHESDRHAWDAGQVELERVDVVRLYDLGSHERVQQWLQVVGAVAHTRHQVVGVDRSTHGATVYVGKKSRRIAHKYYGKGGELRANPLPRTLHRRTDIEAYAAGLLRVEVVLRRRALKERRLARAAAWDEPVVARRILDERLSVVEMEDRMQVSDDVLAQLPARLIPVYDSWHAGRNVRTLYSRPTFYRCRRALLDYGVDIGASRLRLVHAASAHPMGIPVKDVLCGKEVGPPAWAGTPALRACS